MKVEEMEFASFFVLSSAEWIAFGAVCFLFVVHLLGLLRYRRVCSYVRAEEAMAEEDDVPLPPLSVVLVVHDEVKLLQENLPAILEQDYPEFEVIVVNDTDSDEVEEALGSLQARYSNLYHTFVPAEGCRVSRRKLALTIGIKATHYEHLVFTGCDCRPSSPQWLRKMGAGFADGKELVFGYSRYLPSENRHERRVRFAHFFAQLRYLSYALAGKPYMAYGKNLAYCKELFFRQKGFAGYFHIIGGEDDVFVNRAASAENVSVVLSPESVVEITACPWPSLWRQECFVRRQSAALLRGGQPFSWMAEDVLCFLFQLSAVALGAYGAWVAHYGLTVAAVVLLLVRFGVFAALMRSACRALQEPPFCIPLLFLAVRRTVSGLFSASRTRR